MSVRDVIWLRAARGLKRKAESEAELEKFKQELEIRMELFKQLRNLLSDIRWCVFSAIEFDTTKDPLAVSKAWYALPSMVEAGCTEMDAILPTMSEKDRQAYLREKEERLKAREAERRSGRKA